MSFSLQNKRVAVLGLGLTGQSCVRFAQAKGANVVALDSRSQLKTDVDIPLHLGEFDSKWLQQSDLILISPGVDPQHPAIEQAAADGIEIIGDIELFARFNQRPVIAVTGSNGKSTVVSLCAAILRQQGRQVLLGGNIGTPALDLLDQPGEIVVLELSSFQLETVSSLQPLAAAVLNVSEDHIDRHGSVQNYAGIKQRIYQHAERCVFSLEDELTRPAKLNHACGFSLRVTEQGWGYDAESGDLLFNAEPVLTLATTRLVGLHNVMNLQACAALVAPLDVPFSVIQAAADNFEPLPHRCQLVGRFGGVEWVNDSKATNVGATLAAIEGLQPGVSGVLTLILGGDSKGADVSGLKTALNQDSVRVITLGQDGHLFAALRADAVSVNSLQQAVETAAGWAKKGDMVLLSPACASMDMFTNYQQRGDVFAQAVRELAA